MKNKTNISVKDIRGIRVTPSIIIGQQGDYSSGDILDANATQQLIDSSIDYPPSTGIPESDLSDDVKQKLNSFDPTEYYTKTQVDTVVTNNAKIAIVNVESGTSTITAAANTHYNVAGEVGTLSIVLPAITDTTHLQFVSINLTTGSTPAITFSSAASDAIEYFANYTIEEDTSYEFNCMFNGSKWIIGYGTIDQSSQNPL